MKKQFLNREETKEFVNNYCLENGIKEAKIYFWRKRVLHADKDSIRLFKTKNRIDRIERSLDLYRNIQKKNESFPEGSLIKLSAKEDFDEVLEIKKIPVEFSNKQLLKIKLSSLDSDPNNNLVLLIDIDSNKFFQLDDKEFESLKRAA